MSKLRFPLIVFAAILLKYLNIVDNFITGLMWLILFGFLWEVLCD